MPPSNFSKSYKNIKIWTNNDINEFKEYTNHLHLTDILNSKGFPLNILLNKNNIFDEKKESSRKIVVEHLIDFNNKKHLASIFLQSIKLNNKKFLLFANDIENKFFCSILEQKQIEYSFLIKFLSKISLETQSSLSVFPSGTVVEIFKKNLFNQSRQIDLNHSLFLKINLEIYPENITELKITNTLNKSYHSKNEHLDYLENESIHIIREAFAESKNPVMLYSIGKDSSVMLHLAMKAFFPNKVPFPLLHVDTKWKFKTMYSFRNYISSYYDLKLLIHSNKEGLKRNINPFIDGSEIHTEIMKTQALKEALDIYKFDVVFGGARRDEEKSRAKERIFSFRNSSHAWDPKNQRPELWGNYNTRKKNKESIRVFPLSNWTELDIWQYIYQEEIELVPLYFASERKVIERNGILIDLNDDRLRILPEENVLTKQVRFRTLGCYPLTGAIESSATTLEQIVLELLKSTSSERVGRAIDKDENASMEQKKKEGYF